MYIHLLNVFCSSFLLPSLSFSLALSPFLSLKVTLTLEKDADIPIWQKPCLLNWSVNIASLSTAIQSHQNQQVRLRSSKMARFLFLIHNVVVEKNPHTLRLFLFTHTEFITCLSEYFRALFQATLWKHQDVLVLSCLHTYVIRDGLSCFSGGCCCCFQKSTSYPTSTPGECGTYSSARLRV